MLQIEKCILFGYTRGQNPKFTMQHMLLSPCLGSSLDTVSLNVPQLFYISSHWVQADSSEWLCSVWSAAPSRMTFTGMAHLQGCSLSNVENSCHVTWIGLAVVKSFISKSKHCWKSIFWFTYWITCFQRLHLFFKYIPELKPSVYSDSNDSQSCCIYYICKTFSRLS